MSADLKNTKFGVQDAVFIADFGGLGTTAFGEKGQGKLANFARQIIFVDPNATALAFGSNVRFVIPKRQVFVGPTHLKVTFSAVSGAHLNGRLVEYAGMRMANTMQLRYSTNTLQTIQWQLLHLLYALRQNNEKQAVTDFLTKGSTAGGTWGSGAAGQAARAALATAAQTLWCDIPFMYTRHPSKYMLTEALAHEVEVDWQMPTLAQMTQSDNAVIPTFTVSAAQLRLRCFHTEDVERDFHIDRTLQDTGVVSACTDFEYILTATPTGTGTQRQVSLESLRGATTEIRFVIRNAADLATPGTNAYLPFTYQQLLNWQIDAAGGLAVVRNLNHAENIFIENGFCHTAEPLWNVYGMATALDPEDELNATGEDNYGNFTTATLTMNFTADPGSILVDVIAITKNTWQEVKGDYVKNFQ